MRLIILIILVSIIIISAVWVAYNIFQIYSLRQELKKLRTFDSKDIIHY